MKRTMINNVFEEQEKIKLSGWVHRIRKMKNIVFVILRDRTGLIQCVINKDAFEACNISLESVISVSGQVVSNANALSEFEVQCETIDVLNRVLEELPIQINKKDMNLHLDTRLKNRVLSLRHEKEQAVFRIQSKISQLFQEFFIKREFTEIHSPKLVKEGAEGGANVFKLDYFSKEAFLAQSPQFYKQMMVIAGYERVFEIGSVFRAEQHSSNRHLNEYVSLDMEMGFIESELDLIEIETDLLKFIIESLNTEMSFELSTLDVKLPSIGLEIPVLTFSEVQEILKSKYGMILEEGDLNPEGERHICDHIKSTKGSDFLFITAYPKSKRPMYALPEGAFTKSFDLLFKGLEITTGGMRIHNLSQLIENMKYKGLNPALYESYLEAFKYGAPPHGGFAIGLERLTAQLLGFDNVRRTSLFPRDMDRLTP